MILIVGSHQDDVLYCASLLNKKTDEMLLGRFPVQKGTIFNQEVMIVSGIHTSVLASSVVTYILANHYVSLIFVLGKCYSINKGLKNGAILISKEVIDIDVDQIDVANAMVNQVPGLPVSFKTQMDVIGYLTDGFSKRTLATPKNVTFLSTDNLNSPAVAKAKADKSTLGLEGPFAIDSVSYGVALASRLRDVPSVSIKCVERDIDEPKNLENYLSTLDTYVEIGKAVVYTIGDIGRSDVLRLRRQG